MSNAKSAIEIGQVFLNKAEENNMTLTTMQLLKLVYIAHGWMLGLHKEPLINETVEAWQYGPVIPSLYNRIRHTRGKAIKEKISNVLPVLKDYQESIIDFVFKKYAKYDGWHLSNITHKSDTPWYISKFIQKTIEIPNYLIEEYYRAVAFLVFNEKQNG